ncbi:hypothetical protein CEUSTIGMA_g11678.t1 [Chlamydomonas eustigma]|uniref:PUM-HD domain-containing protein n=1 Tax=Chlamydomonas eustigma TaxID=1157962 RepID=A0A250XMD4_9CHLO|nr:hypothetical protein CEUSTIGMA_g11678.t1 [Chlamydomonas eustigma]|eukprot:GAX84255.1 hypothetical protein CEUSTIGMA_g11678.t1 [Chlamydomonas eustigma]
MTIEVPAYCFQAGFQSGADYEFGSSNSIGGRKRGPHTSEVPQETIQYLEEVVAHFKTLTDGEEKELLVGNVMEELKEKEVQVAGDQVCSRHVETLLTAASPQQLIHFLSSMSEVNALQQLSSSPFGSHVVEKMLIALDKSWEGLPPDQQEQTNKLLDSIQQTICSQLYEYITDRYATHVARRLLCVAAGRNVLPPSKAQREGLTAAAAKSKVLSGLAARVGGGMSGGSSVKTSKQLAASLAITSLVGDDGQLSEEPRFPQMLLAASKVLSREDMQGSRITDIVFSQNASPYVQGLLKSMTFDRKALIALVPCILGASYFVDSAKAGKVLEGVEPNGFETLVRDHTGSHVLEAVVQASPPALFEELHHRFLAGNLAELSMHPSANFVVQAALSVTSSAAIVKSMFGELSGMLGDLLGRRRGGVVVSLVGACSRCGVCQREMCAALEKALMSIAPWSGLTAEQALAPSLLCLDLPPLLGPPATVTSAAEPDPTNTTDIHSHSSTADNTRNRGGAHPSSRPYREGRLSPLGASILINVLGFGQGACRQFTDSVAGLRGVDAAKMSADPSGSRVAEALLAGSAPIKVKSRFMQSLKGHFSVVAKTAAGSFVVERCYDTGDSSIKEAVVSELVSKRKEIEVTHWGPSLLKKVGSEAYTRDPEQWRRHCDTMQKTVAQFSQLFAGGGVSEAAGSGAGRAAGNRDRNMKQPPLGKPLATDSIGLPEMVTFKADKKRKLQKQDERVHHDVKNQVSRPNSSPLPADLDNVDGGQPSSSAAAQTLVKQSKQGLNKKSKLNQMNNEAISLGDMTRDKLMRPAANSTASAGPVKGLEAVMADVLGYSGGLNDVMDDKKIKKKQREKSS